MEEKLSANWVADDYFVPHNEPPIPDHRSEEVSQNQAFKRGTVIGASACSFEATGALEYIVRGEDGEVVVVPPDPFSHLRRHDRVVLFRTTGGWSLKNPRWYCYPVSDLIKAAMMPVEQLIELLPEGPIREELQKFGCLDGLGFGALKSRFDDSAPASRELAKIKPLIYGSLTEASMTGFDSEDSNWVVGQVDGVKVAFDHALLASKTWKKTFRSTCFPCSFKGYIIDPSSRPVRLRLKSQSEASAAKPVRLRFIEQLAVAGCCQLWGHIFGQIIQQNDHLLCIDTLGLRTWVPTESIEKLADQPLPLSWSERLVWVRVEFDKTTADYGMSVKTIGDKDWQNVKASLSPGKVVREARFRRFVDAGLLFEAGGSGERFDLIVPFESREGVTQSAGDFELALDDSVALCVDSVDDERRLVISSFAEPVEVYPALRSGLLIPVRARLVGEEQYVGEFQPRKALPMMFLFEEASEGPLWARVCETTPGIFRLESAGRNVEVIYRNALEQRSVVEVERVAYLAQFLDLTTEAVTGACSKQWLVGLWFRPEGPVLCLSGTPNSLNARVEGVITEITKGGFLVKLQAVTAFLPSGELDTILPKDPKGILGKTKRFAVLSYDLRARRFVVSRKVVVAEELAIRRERALDSLQVGTHVKGTVKNIVDFGAFIELGDIIGLIHINDISWGRVKHPSEMLKVGQEIDGVILEINKEKERVNVGLKQKMGDPWVKIDTKYPIGAKVKGKVVNLVHYGAFVELEPGVEGLVHVNELSWTKRVAKPSDVLKQDQEVEVVVLSINREEQKVSLSIRQLERNPFDNALDKYPLGSRVKGKIRKFTSDGAFIELEDGLSGMIHISDMSWTRKINHPSKVIKMGDDVEAVVLEVDKANQRIAVGMKQLTPDPWEGIDQIYKVGDLVTGAVTKLAPFGAFVGLQHDDGLVHISQISEERIDKIKNVLKVGQEVTARVIAVDRNERRIELSIKAVNYDVLRFGMELCLVAKRLAASKTVGTAPPLAGESSDESSRGATDAALEAYNQPLTDFASAAPAALVLLPSDAPTPLQCPPEHQDMTNQSVGEEPDHDGGGLQTGAILVEEGTPPLDESVSNGPVDGIESKGLHEDNPMTDKKTDGSIQPEPNIEPQKIMELLRMLPHAYGSPIGSSGQQRSDPGTSTAPPQARSDPGPGKTVPSIPETPATGSTSSPITPAIPTERAARQPDPQAFSPSRVCSDYPAPIAFAYHRFIARKEPHGSFDSLVAAVEATVRYLFALAFADLLRLADRDPKSVRDCLSHNDLGFLRRNAKVSSGHWVGALRLVCTRLGKVKERVFPELAELCGQGQSVMRKLEKLGSERNHRSHPAASISLTEDQCRRVVRDLRPVFESMLQEIAFVRDYPLGFVLESRGAVVSGISKRYRAFNFMGSSPRIFLEYLVALDADIEPSWPFVICQNTGDLVYLWPLFTQRESPVLAGHETIYCFEKTLGKMGGHLADQESHAINVPSDPWTQESLGPRTTDFEWLITRLRAAYERLPAANSAKSPYATLLRQGKHDLGGCLVGGYRLASLIARGGGGEVYLAHGDDGVEKAVKVLRGEYLEDDLERFTYEFQKLREHSHSGIIKFYDDGWATIDNKEEIRWYAMEYAENGDLTLWLHDEQSPSWTGEGETQPRGHWIIKEFIGVLDPLEYLHSQEFIHRDLKPANILICKGGKLKIGDFGLIKNRQPSTKTLQRKNTTEGRRLGTAGYIAPEQNQGLADARSDIYSLGVVLAELCLSKNLQHRLASGDPFHAVANQDLQALPEPLRKTILRCTALKPEDRFASIQALRKALEDFLMQSSKSKI